MQQPDVMDSSTDQTVDTTANEGQTGQSSLEQTGISDSQIGNPDTTTTEPAKPSESAGIKNLRQQYESLSKDVKDKFRPVFERVETLGGLPAIEAATSFYDSYVVDNFDPVGFAKALHSLSKRNFSSFAYHLVDSYPELMDSYIEHRGIQRPESQQPQQPQELDLDPSDPFHAAILQKFSQYEERLGKYEQSDAERQQKETQLHKEREQKEAEKRADGVQNGLLENIDKTLAELIWSDKEKTRLKNSIIGRFRLDTKFQQDLQTVSDAAYQDEQGILARKLPSLQRYVNNVIAEEIKEFDSLRLPQQVKTERKEISQGTSSKPTPKAYSSNSLRDDDFRADLANALRKSLGR